jgi:3-oxoadipate enol-lactonase
MPEPACASCRKWIQRFDTRISEGVPIVGSGSGHDTTARLGAIHVPALVIAGALDQGTPVEMAKILAGGIPRAPLVVLADASHLSAVERPETFEVALPAFIAGL